MAIVVTFDDDRAAAEFSVRWLARCGKHFDALATCFTRRDDCDRILDICNEVSGAHWDYRPFSTTKEGLEARANDDLATLADIVARQGVAFIARALAVVCVDREAHETSPNVAETWARAHALLADVNMYVGPLEKVRT